MALVTSGSGMTVIVLDNEETDALATLLEMDLTVPAGIDDTVQDRLVELADALWDHADGRD